MNILGYYFFINLFLFYLFIYGCVGSLLLRMGFIYFWLRWVFVAARGLSLVAASGGYSSLW